MLNEIVDFVQGMFILFVLAIATIAIVRVMY